MKQIKINTIVSPVKNSPRSADKFYFVHLGNGIKKEFPNKKEALAFLADTNKELNIKLYELNFLYSDCLRLFRSSWLYFDKKVTGLNNIELVCIEKFQRIETAFNLLVDRSGWESGNFLVFSHFKNIIAELVSVCNMLKQIFKKRGVTAALYEVESYILRSEYIQTAIFIYPNKIKLVREQLDRKTNLLKAV